MASSHHALRATTVRSALRAVTMAWVFGAAWQYATSSAALTQFATSLGMPEWGFGLLAMMPLLAGMAQLPAGLVLARFGHRRRVFLVSTVASRLSWTALAAIPWVLPRLPGWWWPALIALVLLSSVGGNVGYPSWMNWMSEVIPWKVRGRYFAARNAIGYLIGAVVTLGVGLAMDHFEKVGAPGVMLKATAVILGVSGLVGALDPLWFLKLRDDAPPAARAKVSLAGFFAGPLSDRSFRWYLGYNFVFTFGCTAYGQYMWLYALYVVKMSNTMANVLVQIAAMIGMAGTYGLWGRLMDRVGRRPVLVLCTAISVLQPLGWMLMRPGLVWIGFAISVPTLLSWAGLEVANFNLLLNLAGSRPGRHGGAWVALQALAAGAGGVVSSLLGSAIAGRFKDWAQPVGFLGVVLTYHSLIFAFTAAARIAACWMARQIREPESHGTRRVMRHITASINASVKQMITLPTWLGPGD